MTTIEIQDKQIYDAFGTVKTIATKAQVRINYEVGQLFANGNLVLMNSSNTICASFSKKLSTEGWGEDDSFIINKLFEAVGVIKK